MALKGKALRLCNAKLRCMYLYGHGKPVVLVFSFKDSDGEEQDFRVEAPYLASGFDPPEDFELLLVPKE